MNSDIPDYMAELLKGMLKYDESERLSWPEIFKTFKTDDGEKLGDLVVSQLLINKHAKWELLHSTFKNEDSMTLKFSTEYIKDSSIIAKKLKAIKEIEHPNILKILDIQEKGKYVFITYEKFSETSLKSICRSISNPDVRFEKSLHFYKQLIDVFSYLNKRKDQEKIHFFFRSTEIFVKGFDLKIANLGVYDFFDQDDLITLSYEPEKLIKHSNFSDYLWNLGYILYEISHPRGQHVLNPFNINLEREEIQQNFYEFLFDNRR